MDRHPNFHSPRKHIGNPSKNITKGNITNPRKKHQNSPKEARHGYDWLSKKRNLAMSQSWSKPSPKIAGSWMLISRKSATSVVFLMVVFPFFPHIRQLSHRAQLIACQAWQHHMQTARHGVARFLNRWRFLSPIRRKRSRLGSFRSPWNSMGWSWLVYLRCKLRWCSPCSW